MQSKAVCDAWHKGGDIQFSWKRAKTETVLHTIVQLDWCVHDCAACSCTNWLGWGVSIHQSWRCVWSRNHSIDRPNLILISDGIETATTYLKQKNYPVWLKSSKRFHFEAGDSIDGWWIVADTAMTWELCWEGLAISCPNLFPPFSAVGNSEKLDKFLLTKLNAE